MITTRSNNVLRVLLTLTALSVFPSNNNGVLVSARVTKSSKGKSSKSVKGSGPEIIDVCPVPLVTKSSKSAKGFCPVPLVTAEVNEITGSGDVTTGKEAFDAFGGIYSACLANDPLFGPDFADCIESSDSNGVFFDYPLFAFNNDGGLATSQFVTAATPGASPSSLNDSYFRGNVDGTDPSEPQNKVDIQWTDYSLEGLFDVPIADIEYIQYDFYPEDCGITMSDSECIAQFYLNVYTHRAIPGAGTWYDCKYDFVPIGDVDFHVGEWNTFTVYPDTASSRTVVKGACPDGASGLETGTGNHFDGVTLEDGADTGVAEPFLLGAAGATGIDPNPLIFAFNMGDTSMNDIGLVGYLDNIRVKIVGEPLIIMDL